MGIARIAVLVVAALAAGGTALLVRGMMSDSNQASANAPAQIVQMPTTEVLVAAVSLERGQSINRGSLRWQPWPDESVNSTYITKAYRPNALEETDNATVRIALGIGEPVTLSKVITLDNTGFMAAVLNPGMRAISTKITPETGAGGFILPNDRVDVILTESRRGGSGRRRATSQTILINIRVLAIDQTFADTDGKQTVIGKTATLELTPRQAEVLALSKASGEVSLSLRSLADSDSIDEATDNLPNSNSRALRVVRYGAESVISMGSAQ